MVRPVADPWLVLRTAPTADSTRVDCLAPGASLARLDAVPLWRRVRLADTARPVAGDDVVRAGPVEEEAAARLTLPEWAVRAAQVKMTPR